LPSLKGPTAISVAVFQDAGFIVLLRMPTNSSWPSELRQVVCQHSWHTCLDWPSDARAVAVREGFSQGFNIGEAANFATTGWLPFGALCEELYRRLKGDPILPRQELLCREAAAKSAPWYLT
jgi:hypothetical protein